MEVRYVKKIFILESFSLFTNYNLLVEWICKKHGTKLIVQNQPSAGTEDTGELAEDLLAVVNFSASRSNERSAARNGKQGKV